MSEQLFDQFSNLGKLNKEKDAVLSIFKDIAAAIDSLNEKGLLMDSAKNLGQLAKFMRDFDAVQGRVAEGLDKVSAAQSKNQKITLQDIEAIKKAKGLTDEYVASLIKLAQSKQTTDSGQPRERAMTANQLYRAHQKSDPSLTTSFKDLDAGTQALYTYAAQFSKMAPVVEEVGDALGRAGDRAREHAEGSKAATDKVKDHTDALKDNTDAAEDNASAQEKWAKAIEAQKARAAQLVARVSTTPAVDTLSDNMADNVGTQLGLKDQLAEIKAAKKELAQLNQGEFAGAFTDDIIQLAQAEEQLKLQISQVTRFIKNQTKEMLSQQGSADQLRAQLNQLTQIYDGMGEKAEATEAGQALKRQINEITAAVKAKEEGTDRYFRSVGKYAESLAPLFDKLSAKIAALKEEQSALQQQGKGGVQQVTPNRVGFVIPGTDGPERLNQINAQLAQLESLQQAASTTTGSYAQQVRVLDSALSEMAKSGGDSIGFVIELKDALQDAKLDNLGNFEGSAKIIVEAFEEARVKVRSLSETVGENAPETRAARAEYEALSRVVENPQFLNVAGKVGDATGEIKFFTKALNDMEAQGLKGSAVYQQVQKRLAELTDQIGDTRAEIKAMSSDTRSFDLVASGINTLISSYQTYVGVAAMAGANEEELQQSMQKLLAVQNVANGVREIANELTTKGTLANKAYAYVQGLVATATNASATATVRLGAALKFAGIGLLIGAVALLVIQMQKLARASDEAGRRRKLLLDIERSAAQSYGQEKAQLDTLMTSLKTEGITRKEKMQIIEQLQQKYPGYFDNIKTEKDLNEKLAEAYERASKGILLKAQAQAAGDRLAQNEQKRLEAELNLSEKIAATNEKEREQLAMGSTGNRADYIKLVRQTAVDSRRFFAQQYSETISEIDKENELIIASITNANNQIKALGGQVEGTKTDDKKPKDATGDIQKNAEARRKALFDIQKRGIQDEIAAFDDLAKSEKQSYRTRLLAAASLYEAKARLASASKEFDLSEVTIREKQEIEAAKKEELTQEQRAKLIASIQKKYAAERLNIESSYSSEVLKIQSETTEQVEELQKGQSDKLKEDREKGAQSEFDRIQTNLSNHLQGIREAADAELAIEIDKFARGEISKEQYEQRKLDIEADARAKSLKAEIDYYKALVSVSGLPEDKKKEALQKLYELEERLRQENLKREEGAANKKWELTEEFYERARELGAELKEMTLSLFTGDIDQQKQQAEEQMQLTERKAQKEIDAINATGASEAEKQQKIKKIEATTAAQREALEYRKRRLDLERARYERAANIAGIIGNTAKGVAEALPNIPLSILVGAIGAAQLIKVLGTQVPGYWTGTESSKEGYAQVAERGRELAVDPQGKLVLYEKPAITYLQGGTKIYNNRETERILRENKTVPSVAGNVVPAPVVSLSFKAPAKSAAAQPLPAPRLVPAPALQAESAQPVHRPLTAYLKGPMIPIQQVYRDMFRAQEQERHIRISLHQKDLTAQAVKSLEAKLGQAVDKLARMERRLKEISQNSRINIYNEHDILTSADKDREMARRLLKE